MNTESTKPDIRIYPLKQNEKHKQWKLEINGVLVRRGYYNELRPMYEVIRGIVEGRWLTTCSKCRNRYSRKRRWKIEYFPPGDYGHVLMFDGKTLCQKVHGILREWWLPYHTKGKG